MEYEVLKTLTTSTVSFAFNRICDHAIGDSVNDLIYPNEALGDVGTACISAAKIIASSVDFLTVETHEQQERKKVVDQLTKLLYDVEDKLENNGKIGLTKLSEKIKNNSNRLKELTGQISANNTITQCIGPLGLFNQKELRGREIDMEAIVKEIKSCSLGVTIVGMPGLGKTMLAVKILECSAVVEEFDTIRVNDFRSHNIAQKIQDRHDKNSCGTNQKQKSLLILIDNMVEPPKSEWDSFRSEILGKDVKIIITTCNCRVSVKTSTTAYQLKPLSDEACAEIIVDTLQSPSDNKCIMIARKLSMKCGGLPQVAEMLGAALRSCGENRWNDIVDEDLWENEDFKKDVVPRLTSMYQALKFYQLKCLAYFSLFPSSYCYPRDELIQLWAAEGFIYKAEDENDVSWLKRSHKYAQELVDRSILEVCYNGTATGQVNYKLHEFNHKFSELTASNSFLHFKEDTPNKPGSKFIRHFSTSSTKTMKNSEVWKNLRKSKLRTFIADPAPDDSNTLLHDAFAKLKRLRVLALKRIRVAEIPESVEKLKSLQYLDISYSTITKLPEKISKLTSLQFLRIKETRKLKILPNNFKNLSNLVFIDWEESDIRRFNLPCNIGNLSCLHNLPLFPVNDNTGCTIAALGSMVNLKGSIWITNLEKVSTVDEAVAAKLGMKESLETMKLEWSEPNNSALAKEILTALEPHNNLKKLTIVNGVFPSWVWHGQRELEIIHLKNCRSGGDLPLLGKLPILTTLKIEGVDDLQTVTDSFCGTLDGNFKSLESLIFSNLSGLEEWRSLEPTAMPRLKELKILNCPRLVVLPALETLTSLVELQIEECPELRSLPFLPDSLKSLIIRDSNFLKASCQVGGEDREKLQFIPKVEIDLEIILPTAPASAPAPSLSPLDQIRQAIYVPAGGFGHYITRK